MKSKIGAVVIAMILVLTSCSSGDSSSENDAPTPPGAKDVGQVAFQYNLDKSLPEEWVSEFQSIMKNLGETLPISPKLNEFLPNEMNIYAWNSAVENPFTDEVEFSGAYIGGDPLSMVLEIQEGEFETGDLHRYAVIVHEYFHVYQINISLVTEPPAPKWILEGGAKLVEEIYSQQYYGKNNLQSELNNPDLWSKDVFTNPSLYEQDETSSGEAQTGGWIDMNYAGSAYMLLTLVKELQKQGISEQRAFEMVFRDFWLEKSKQSDWKIAFKQVFKMDVNTFYETLKTQTRNDANKLLPSESLTIQEIFVSK